MRTRKAIVCELHANPTQYRYLQHQIQLTMRMYVSTCKEVQRNVTEVTRSNRKQLPILSEKEIKDKLKAYQRHYMKQMEEKELQVMLQDVLNYQRNCVWYEQAVLPLYYACQVSDASLYWRGIGLYPLLRTWHGVHKPWYFVSAKLYYHRQRIYLRILLHHP